MHGLSLVLVHSFLIAVASLVLSTGSRAQAQYLWALALLLRGNVRTFQIRDGTCVSCIGWWTLSQQTNKNPPQTRVVMHVLEMMTPSSMRLNSWLRSLSRD